MPTPLPLYLIFHHINKLGISQAKSNFRSWLSRVPPLTVWPSLTRPLVVIHIPPAFITLEAALGPSKLKPPPRSLSNVRSRSGSRMDWI